MTRAVAPWQALAHLGAEALSGLDDLDWALLESDPAFALRVDQQPTRDSYRYLGYLGGRGLGKTYALGKILTREIDEQRIKDLALLAQNEDKSWELQAETLMSHCSPWNKCHEYRGRLVWENGATATIYTPESPGNPRGFNGDACWLSELVAWPAATRQEAFDNIITATRVGLARVFWDTTSKGRNELISYMMQLHAHDPDLYQIVRGTMFDNPLLGRDYLREQCSRYSGRRYDEEVLGRVFEEADGAIYEQSWISDARVTVSPEPYDLTLVSLDPGVSTKENVDGTGIVVASRKGQQIYVRHDLSGEISSDKYADLVIDWCEREAAGVVVETNKGGNLVTSVIRARAQLRPSRLDVRVLGRGDRWPRRTPGVIYVRETFSRSDKLERGQGPAALYEGGRVSHVGLFPDLERELCTYDGDGRSPNRFDALNQVVSELAELAFVHTSHAARAAAQDVVGARVLLRDRLLTSARGRRVV